MTRSLSQPYSLQSQFDCERLIASGSCDSMHALLIARPVLFSKLLLQYLSGPAFWKGVEELDRLGNLEARQHGSAMVDQFLLTQRCARLYDDQSFRNFAPSIVRHGYDCAFEDRRM